MLASSALASSYYANKLRFAYWQDDATKQMMRGDANIIAYMSWKE